MKRLIALVFIGMLSCAEVPAPSSDSGPRLSAEGPTDAAVEAGTVGLEATPPKFTVHFSPKGGCTDSIVQFILSAKSEILVQAYSFTSKPIADALVLQSKKVSVRVILDSDEHQNAAGRAILLTGGVPVWSDAKHVIAHNKVIVVDGKAVEMGSFNYTAQADNGNAENCAIVRDMGFAGQYAANWNLHLSHSVAVSPSVLDAGVPEAGSFFRR